MHDQKTLQDPIQPVNVLPIIARYVKNLRIAIPIFLVCFAAALAYIALAKQLDVIQYTAAATVGPPDADSLSNPANLQLSGASSLISSALNGQLAGSNPVFDEYLQLMTSVRLSRAIMRDQPQIMPLVFYEKWDEGRKRWYPRNDLFHTTIDFLKGLLNIPSRAVPNEDNLFDFLQQNLHVSTPYTTSFASISLDFHNADQASLILSTLLNEADRLIREEKRSDVGSRIRYLEKVLPTATVSDQRDALIAALSKQQQMMAFIAADKRFASTMVDAPHSPQKPTSPSLVLCLVMAFFVAFLLWSAAIFLPLRSLFRPVITGQGHKAGNTWRGASL